MKSAALFKDAFTGPGSLARRMGAGMLVTTLAAQHPHLVFDRARTKDLFSMLPNWKFFAPNPAVHDFHHTYRTLDSDGETSEWREIEMIASRKLYQAFWFASRRPEKAVFDICTAILQEAQKGGVRQAQALSSYQLLVEFVRSTIREEQGEEAVKGFQFAVVRAAGHDRGEEPETLFVSPYTPMTTPAPQYLAAA